MTEGGDIFLVCFVLGALACLFWREILWLLTILGVTVLCTGLFYVAVGIHSVVAYAQTG